MFAYLYRYVLLFSFLDSWSSRPLSQFSNPEFTCLAELSFSVLLFSLQSWRKWTSVWLELKRHPSCLSPFTCMKEIDCKTFPFYQLLHYFILIWFVVRVSLCWRLILILLNSGVLLFIKITLNIVFRISTWLHFPESWQSCIPPSAESQFSFNIMEFHFFVTSVCCGHLTVARYWHPTICPLFLQPLSLASCCR